jgi:hypothetical protein
MHTKQIFTTAPRLSTAPDSRTNSPREINYPRWHSACTLRLRMSDDNDPATKGDIRSLEATLRGELATKDEVARIRAELDKRPTREELEARFAQLATREEVDATVARHFQGLEESFRTHFGALQDLLMHNNEQLRRDLAAHIADPDAHRRDV